MWAAGSGSNGSDLMASGSNRACRLQIGWLGCLVAEGGGGTRQNPLFRGDARWGSPEFANPALRGSIRLTPGSGVNNTPCVIDLGY